MFQVFFVFDCPLDGLDGVLDVDEGLTHPFRLAALVRLRQCIRNVATLFYLTVPCRNQLSNVLVFLLSQRSSPQKPALPLENNYPPFEIRPTGLCCFCLCFRYCPNFATAQNGFLSQSHQHARYDEPLISF